MSTRLFSVVFDTHDTSAQARFWSVATGWPVTLDEEDEAVVEPPEDAEGRPTEPGILLVFVPVPEAKAVKNRIHIDLASRSPEHQAELVERLTAAGATPADIGQHDVPWVVLADPEGNELCVLEPRDEFAEAGVIAAVVVDSPDPAALAPFWGEASGWTVRWADDQIATLVRPDGAGPHLDLLRNDDARVAKNRLHLDVAPYAGDDHAAEVERLLALGASHADVGQGTQTWVVLADPQGNEFCVLSPRG